MTVKIHSIKQWARSAGKHPIELFSSHKLEDISSKSPVLLIGGVHGDEPEGVKLATELLEHYKLIEPRKFAWILIPCINPDGTSIGERTNANGVDLNRNFPSKCWTNEHDKERYFPGNSAGSEPETIALVELIQKVKPSLVIHFHSWKPMIVYSNQKAENIAKRLSQDSGFELKNDIGYPTPGSLGEYAGNDLDIGVVCIEEQDNQNPEDMQTIFPRFKNVLEDIS